MAVIEYYSNKNISKDDLKSPKNQLQYLDGILNLGEDYKITNSTWKIFSQPKNRHRGQAIHEIPGLP